MEWKVFLGLVLVAVSIEGYPATLDHNVSKHGDEINNRDISSYHKIIYSSNHTITSLIPSVYADESSPEDEQLNVFFNEVDVKDDGTHVVLGQYLYTRSGDGDDANVRKIFNGQCFTVHLINVYFGAADGLYEWNRANKTTTRVGNITDNIIELHVVGSTETIYYLTEPEHRIYTVDLNGGNKTLVESIPTVTSFVLDKQENIYFYDKERVLRVYRKNIGNSVKFTSLTVERKVILLRPPMDFETGVPTIVDDKIYILYSNGTAVANEEGRLQENVTSLSMESAILVYYASNGDIHEINILILVAKGLLGWVRSLLSGT